MRAIVVDLRSHDLHPADIATPSPGEGEVLIRMSVATVNFADVLLRDGLISTGPPPVIPGLDVAGTISAVGPGVAGLAVGNRVAAFCGGGAYAEYVTAASSLTWLVPSELDDVTAASVPTVGVTAFNLLTIAAPLVPGNSVLIHSAAGAVGSTCVQVARMLGAGMIIGTVSSDEKREPALRVGCDAVFNRRRTPVSAAVRQLLPHGVDIILDAGGRETLATDLECLAEFGRLVVFGHTSRQEGVLPSMSLNSSNRAVIGYSTTGYSRACPEVIRDAGTAVFRALVEHKLSFVIGGSFSLEDAASAHRAIESGRSVGKLVLRP